MRFKADLTLFLVALLWGSAFVAQRVAGQEGSVYFFNAARFLLGAALLLPFARKRLTFSKPQGLWMLAGGGVLFIASALQQAGIRYTTAGNAGFITSLYVVLVPLLLLVGWRERPHWLVFAGLVLAILGAFLLSTGGKLHLQPGDGLEFAGSFFWALHVVILGKFAKRYDPLSFSLGQFVVAGLLNFLAGLFLESFGLFDLELVLGAVIYTAMVSIGVGYTLQVWAQRHTPPTDAALILSLESVFAVLSGWLVLGEHLVWIQIAGCFLILSGVVLAQIRLPREIKAKLPEVA
jgi:drug/metabolite transporter (DMT)-like permease